MDPATVSWIVTRFRQTGLVLKKSHPSRRAFRKLSHRRTGDDFACSVALSRYIPYEVVRELHKTLGAEVALLTICMFLKKGASPGRSYDFQQFRGIAFFGCNLFQKCPFMIKT